MKKILIFVLSVLIMCFTFCFAGCKYDDDAEYIENVVFERLCTHDIVIYGGCGYYQSFYRDIATDNIYTLTSLDKELVPYFNADGEIMKYKEFEKLHINKYHEVKL